MALYKFYSYLILNKYCKPIVTLTHIASFVEASNPV